MSAASPMRAFSVPSEASRYMHAARWAADGSWINFFLLARQPSSVLEAGQDYVQGSRCEASGAHEVKSVSGLSWIFQELADDQRQRGGDADIGRRRNVGIYIRVTDNARRHAAGF